MYRRLATLIQDQRFRFKEHYDHNLRSTVQHCKFKCETPFHHYLLNLIHFRFRNRTVASSVGIDFRFLRLPRFRVRFWDLKLESVSIEEIKVSRSQNLRSTPLGSVKIQYIHSRSFTLVSNHHEKMLTGTYKLRSATFQLVRLRLTFSRSGTLISNSYLSLLINPLRSRFRFARS